MAATPGGQAVPLTFDFHHDATSDRLLAISGTTDSSNWVCGPRTYTVTFTDPTLASRTMFVTIIDSPLTSTLVKPILKLLTNNNIDIGTWSIDLTVKLTRYPTVIATETFLVKIDQCILNTLTEDSGTYIRKTATSP